MKCPYCGSMVEPTRDAAGAMWCPACGNTGRIAAAQASPTVGSAGGLSPPPTAGPPQPIPGIAIAALVCGIASLVLFPLSIVLGPVALVLGIKALARIKRMPPGRTGAGAGTGFAITGIVLGGVGILVGISVVMAALVFVLVSNLDDMGDPVFNFNVDEDGAGGTLTLVNFVGHAGAWEDYELGGTARCELPRGPVEPGDQIVCVTDGTVELIDWYTEDVVYEATV